MDIGFDEFCRRVVNDGHTLRQRHFVDSDRVIRLFGGHTNRVLTFGVGEDGRRETRGTGHREANPGNTLTLVLDVSADLEGQFGVDDVGVRGCSECKHSERKHERSDCAGETRYSLSRN